VSTVVGITEISSFVAAAGVLVAAIYYIINLRHNMKAREMEICRLVSSDYTSEQSIQRWATMMNMEWKDFKDFMKRYSRLNPEMFSKWTAQFFAWEMMGILLKNKVVRAEEMHDLGGYSAINGWEKFKSVIQSLRDVAWGQDLSNAEWFVQEMLKVKMKKDASSKDKMETYKKTWKP
jgi:hypothetical protein